MTRDFIGAVVADDGDLAHYGVKGMKWGVRKSDKSEDLSPPSGPETSSAKYDRLMKQSKRDGANSLSDEDLAFVTKRGNAIAQVNRLNEKKPGWVAEVAKQVLKQQTQKRLQSASESITAKYIDEPMRSKS